MCISVGKRKVGHTRDLHFWNQLQMHCPKSMTVPANQVQKGKDYSNFFQNITLRNHINCFKHSYHYSQQNYICIYSKRLSEINTFKLSKYEYAFKKFTLPAALMIILSFPCMLTTDLLPFAISSGVRGRHRPTTLIFIFSEG